MSKKSKTKEELEEAEALEASKEFEFHPGSPEAIGADQPVAVSGGPQAGWVKQPEVGEFVKVAFSQEVILNGVMYKPGAVYRFKESDLTGSIGDVAIILKE